MPNYDLSTIQVGLLVALLEKQPEEETKELTWTLLRGLLPSRSTQVIFDAPSPPSALQEAPRRRGPGRPRKELIETVPAPKARRGRPPKIR